MSEKDKEQLTEVENPKGVEKTEIPGDAFSAGDRVKNLLSNPTDYYLLHPPRQPKAEIAAYVESQGISVPRRFSSLKEAIESGKPFIVRSEHPAEYAGPAGLLTSVKVNPQEVDEVKQLMAQHPEYFRDRNKLKSEMLYRREFFALLIIEYLQDGSQTKFETELIDLDREDIEIYCKSHGLSKEVFTQDISYSYWELLGGTNRSIIEDDAVEGRYHVFSTVAGCIGCDYSIYDNGCLVPIVSVRSKETHENIDQIVAFYERVRRLPRFQTGHCPVIEMQTVEGNQQSFLQYHRMYDSKPAEFSLDRPCGEGEVEAFFVRGATPPEGIVYPVVLYGERNFDPNGAHCQIAPHWGAIGRIYDTKMQAFLYHKETPELFANTVGTRHIQIIKMFGPGIFAVLDLSALGIDVRKFIKEAIDTRKPIITPFRVVSDGRKAYVKIMPSAGF